MEIEKIGTKTKPEQHRKRTATTLKKLSKTLRKRNFFKKNKLPYFLTELLTKLCEYESNYHYSGGSRPQTVVESRFIKELANLLFKYTGQPFEYGKQDLLCKTASSCFLGLGQKESYTAVVSQIRETIAVSGVQKKELFPCSEDSTSDATEVQEPCVFRSYTLFDYDELSARSKLDGREYSPSNLPDDYTFVSACAATKSPQINTDETTGHSPIILANIANTQVLAPLPALLHPNYGLWLSYLNQRSAELQDNRARLLCRLASEFVRENSWKHVFDGSGGFVKRTQACLQDCGEIYTLDEISYLVQFSVGIVLQENLDTPVCLELRYRDFERDPKYYAQSDIFTFKEFYPILLEPFSKSPPPRDLFLHDAQEEKEQNKALRDEIVKSFKAHISKADEE